MPIRIPRGTSDPVIESMIEALRTYELHYPEAQIDLYRQDRVSVRVRIIDPTFVGESRVDRSKRVWRYLDHLPEDVIGDLSSLTLLAPPEVERSFANIDFEDPIPTSL